MALDLNQFASIEICMGQSGFRPSFTIQEWCENHKSDNLPICRPGAVMPQRSVEKRLNIALIVKDIKTHLNANLNSAKSFAKHFNECWLHLWNEWFSVDMDVDGALIITSQSDTGKSSSKQNSFSIGFNGGKKEDVASTNIAFNKG